MHNPYSLEKWLGTPEVRPSTRSRMHACMPRHATESACMQVTCWVSMQLGSCLCGRALQGVDWLAVTIDEYEQKIIRTVGDAAEGVSTSLSSWLKNRYDELVNRRNIEKGLEAGMGAIDMSMSALAMPLSLPLSVTEQVSRSVDAAPPDQRSVRCP